MNEKLAVKLGLALVIIVLLLQALHPAWSFHLRSDTDGFYYSRAKYFLEHGNLTNVGYNEYQPGAILFFLALSPPLLFANTPAVYRATLFAANIALICLLTYLTWRSTGRLANILVLAAILVLTGPIVLYRFDLFVNLMIIGTLLLRQKGKHNWAAFLLGIATATKIYPVLLLPYGLILTYRRRQGIGAVLQQVSLFAAGLGALVFIYMAFFQVDLPQILTDLNVNARKPVHAESVWGSLLTVIPRLTTGFYATGRGDLGIFGVAPEFVIGPFALYNYFWIIVLLVFWAWLFFKHQAHPPDALPVSLAAILLFLIFSKILTAQYLLWFMMLFPLLPIPASGLAARRWLADFFLILLATFVSQYIYPLRYNELLGGFFTNGSFVPLFWLLVARNVLLIILAIRWLLTIGKGHTTQPRPAAASLAE